MYEVSLFYVLGGLVMFPGTTFLLTRYYYTNVIHKLERKMWVLQNTIYHIDTNNLINDVEQKSLSFKEKQMIVSQFLEKKPEYNEVIEKSRLIHEITSAFRNE
tara:strand:+ start:6066 stop:6374 length:309 start_codon:yes stop_codon:yes gene_type:complete